MHVVMQGRFVRQHAYHECECAQEAGASQPINHTVKISLAWEGPIRGHH
jgi:hypothetical protein